MPPLLRQIVVSLVALGAELNRVLLFRHSVAALATGVVMLLAPGSSRAALLCQADAPSVPVVNVLGPAEVGDFTVACTGSPSAPGTVDVNVFYNTNIVTTSTPLLTVDGGAVYTGTLSLGQPSRVSFAGLALITDLSFTVDGVIVDTAPLGFSNTLVPTQVVAFISVVPVGALPISSPQQVVALVVPPSQVPEPASLVLAAIGLLGAGVTRRIRRTHSTSTSRRS